MTLLETFPKTDQAFLDGQLPKVLQVARLFIGRVLLWRSGALLKPMVGWLFDGGLEHFEVILCGVRELWSLMLRSEAWPEF